MFSDVFCYSQHGETVFLEAFDSALSCKCNIVAWSLNLKQVTVLLFELLGVNRGLLKSQRRSMCLLVIFAGSGHVGLYMLPQTWYQILEFGGLGVCMLCSQCSGLCLLLSIHPVCCSAACGLSVLHTECCTSQRAQRSADVSAVLYLHARFQKRTISLHLTSLLITGAEGEVICERCMSKVGLDRLFSGSHTELSAG